MTPRNKIFLPLSLKLFAIFMLVVLVPLTLALSVSWGKFNSRLIEVTKDHLQQSMDEAEHILQREVVARALDIAASGDSARALAGHNRSALEPLLKREMQLAGLSSLVLGDRQGRVLLRLGTGTRSTAALGQLYRSGLRGQSAQAFVLTPQGVPVAHGVAPVRWHGQLIGLVDAGVLLDTPFATHLSQAVGQEVSVIGRSGRRSAASVATAANQPVPSELWELLQRGYPVNGQIVRLGSQDYLGSYRPLRLGNGEVGGAWGLEQPLAPVYAAQREKGLQLLQILGFAVPIVIILVFFFARLFTDALNRLAQASRVIASGDYTQPVALTALDKWTFDEVGELSQNFEGMRQSLLKKQQAILEHIEELNRLNEQIHLEKTTMEAVLNSLADALVVVDAGGQVVLYNPAAAALLQLQAAGRGQSLLEVLRARPLEYRSGGEALERHFQGVLDSGQIWNDELVMAGTATYQFKFGPISEKDGQIRGGVATFHDITEIRRIDQLKSHFISMVSHELRTPLTSIRGYLTLMQAGRVTEPEQLDHILAIVLNQTDQLTSLVNNLLDLARIEAGRIVVKREPLSLDGVVARVVLNLRHLADEKQIALKADIPGDLPEVMGDRDRIGQVLTNLVGNALKFTPAGDGRQVLVQARQAQGMVQVSVSDNGCGIPQEALPRLFTQFFQVDSSDTRSVGGSGLGLAIVKQIVEEHGGTVSVHSLPDEGSTFSFTLQAVAPAPQGATDTAMSRG